MNDAGSKRISVSGLVGGLVAALMTTSACLTGTAGKRLVDPAGPGQAQQTARTEKTAPCPVTFERRLSRPPQIIAPDERVPDFFLATEECEIVDSRALVGKRAFVVVFFASWCKVCEHKMPELKRVIEARSGELEVLFVTLDDAETSDGTEAFLSRHGLLPGSVVTGRDFVGFSLGYNPFRSVPVVVIVGRSGRVVDVQIGVRRGDRSRLIKALDLAINEQPEGRLLTSYPPP
jgi:thiol-disulfide isomerase/thioredoxin